MSIHLDLHDAKQLNAARIILASMATDICKDLKELGALGILAGDEGEDAEMVEQFRAIRDGSMQLPAGVVGELIENTSVIRAVISIRLRAAR